LRSPSAAPPSRPTARRRDWMAAVGIGAIASVGTVAVLAFVGVVTTGSGHDSSPDAASATRAAVVTTVRAITTASVPVVWAVSINGSKARVASAVCIDANGHMVTSRSATLGARWITVQGADNKPYTATLVGSDAMTDLAVLDVPGLENAPVHLGSTSRLTAGANVVVIGGPASVTDWRTDAIVELVATKARRPDGTIMAGVIETDATLTPSAIGGALTMADGSVIGILVRSVPMSGKPVSYAIPIEAVTDIAERITRDGSVTHAWLGATLENSAQGVRVDDVAATGPARSAGLQRGDVLARINQGAATNADSFFLMVERHEPGDTVLLTVRRAGQTLTIPVTLAAYPTTRATSPTLVSTTLAASVAP
jgi:S1-C subfamily serine protease